MKLTETSKEYILEGECECSKCKGTGLYKGFGEQDGAYVICLYCHGTGKVKISVRYTKFEGRKKKENCKRVYTQGMGYCITDRDTKDPHTGRLFPFSKYGCSYEDWLKSAKPIPLKFFGCPYQETNQGLQDKDVNDLYKTRCQKNYERGVVSACKLFPDKEKCWEIFDKK